MELEAATGARVAADPREVDELAILGRCIHAARRAMLRGDVSLADRLLSRAISLHAGLDRHNHIEDADHVNARDAHLALSALRIPQDRAGWCPEETAGDHLVRVRAG